MPEVSRITYQFSKITRNNQAMPLLWISLLAGEKTDRSTSVFNGGMGGAGMSTLHILINPRTEHIIHTIHDDQLQDQKLSTYLKLHEKNEGCSLARVIVRKNEPVKVIQAGET